MHGCVAFTYVCVPYACLGLPRSEAGNRSPGTGVTGGCEPPHRCGESNPGPLEEQTVLLTTKPHPPPQCQRSSFLLSHLTVDKKIAETLAREVSRLTTDLTSPQLLQNQLPGLPQVL